MCYNNYYYSRKMMNLDMESYEPISLYSRKDI